MLYCGRVIRVKQTKIKVTVGVPQKLYAVLKKLAEESGRTVPGYIRWLIWKHLEENDIQVSMSGEKPLSEIRF